MFCRIVWSVKSVSLSVVSNSFATLWMRQEYGRRLPFFSPGHLPHSEIEPRSPTLQVVSLLSEPPGKPSILNEWLKWAGQIHWLRETQAEMTHHNERIMTVIVLGVNSDFYWLLQSVHVASDFMSLRVSSQLTSLNFLSHPRASCLWFSGRP